MTTTVTPLNNQQTACLIGISPMTLRIWRVQGRGPKFTKLGDAKQSGVVYFEEDVLEWLAGRKFASTSAYSIHGRTSSKVHNSRSSAASA